MIDHSQKLISGENLTTDISMVGVGYTIRDCQLSQSKGMTKIFEGLKGLTFIGCNLFNCILPDDAKYEDCLYDPSDRPDNPLQQDVIEPTEEEFELNMKKMMLEQEAIEDYRITIKEQLEGITKVEDMPVKEDLVAAIAEATVTATPIERVKP